MNIKVASFLSAVFIVVACVSVIAAPARAAQLLPAQTLNVTNNKVANLACDGTANDQPALQKLIDSTADHEHTTLEIPAGRTCALGGVTYMRSNITFDFADKAQFTGGLWWIYVSRTPDSVEGPANIVWNNCRFVSTKDHPTTLHTFIHASHITFRNCVWDRVQRVHVLDIGGSHDILVDNNTFIGVGPDFPAGSDKTKESIQGDYATLGGMSVTEKLLKAAGTTMAVYDDAPSHDITVMNSRFLPSYDADGTIERHSAAPFGVHGYTPECVKSIRMCIHEMHFINNYVQDTLDFGPGIGLQENKNAIEHWRVPSTVEIMGNTFRSTSAQNDYAVLLQSPTGAATSGGVVVENNKFVNIVPRNAYVLVKTEGQSGANSGAINDVRICRNQFYVEKPAAHPKLLEIIGGNVTNLQADCSNEFMSLAAPPIASH